MAPPSQEESKTAAKPLPANDDDNRAVRVFVSSTFLDMQRERDVLVRRTFPALRAKFRARSVELLEVDLRWGITQEQSENGQTLPALLAEIDRCRPYFIGLLGERYGWVPPETALTDELKSGFPSIADAAGRSVTEMEIIHGVLSNPEAAKRAIFFERNPEWIDTQSGEDRAAYVSDSDEARAKLVDLKTRVRASGARIIAYAEPDDIASAVEAALLEQIEAQFPEVDAPDVFSQTARLHAAYARERRGLHIGAVSYISELDTWITQADAKPMLITGTSGGGKSTLVANWLARHRATAPNDIVFEHYLGASPDSADPILIVRRLWEHLNRATREIVDQPTDEQALIDGLPQRLAQAHAFAEQLGCKVLIALDGLDKLSNQQDLRWLPTFLPARVRLLASSLDGDALHAAVRRSWATLNVTPLTEIERRELIDHALKHWGRALSRGRTERILASPLSGSPLFLKTLLDELRVGGVENELNARLDDYLAARDIPDLFARVLQRLEGDCGSDFVRHAASLIWASRAGLEETEVLAITGATPLAWAMLRNSLGDALRDQAGRIAFSHDFLRQAVEKRYLADDDERRAAHLAIAARFDGHLTARQAEELPFQLRVAQQWDRLQALLIDLDAFRMLYARGRGELLEHWLPLMAQGRDPETLLCDKFDARLVHRGEWTAEELSVCFDVSNFLHFAGVASSRLEQLLRKHHHACEIAMGAENPLTIDSLTNLALTVQDLGELSEALKLLERAATALARSLGDMHPSTIAAQSRLAEANRQLGDFEAAETLSRQVLDNRLHLLGPRHLQTLHSMASLGSTLRMRGKLSEARAIQAKALDDQQRILGPDDPDTLSAMNDFAITLHEAGQFEEAYDIKKRVYAARVRALGDEHPYTIQSLMHLGLAAQAAGDFNQAGLQLESATGAALQTLGRDHPTTLTAMSNLAANHFAQGNLSDARKIGEEVLQSRTKLFGGDNPDTLVSKINLAMTLTSLGAFSEAYERVSEVLEARVRIFGRDHSLSRRCVDVLMKIEEEAAQKGQPLKH